MIFLFRSKLPLSKILKTSLMAVALLTILGSQVAHAEQIKAAKVALPALNGDEKFVGDKFNSELTVIQFWASWCTGCGTVMTDMMELLPKYTKVKYINISLDETKDIALKFFVNKSEQTKSALKYSYLDVSGQHFSEINKVESLPYLLIINNKGEIIKRVMGHPTKNDLAIITK